MKQPEEAPFSPRGGQDDGDLDPLFGLEHLTLAEDVVPEARALRTWPYELEAEKVHFQSITDGIDTKTPAVCV